MECNTCGGSMSRKTKTIRGQQKTVFECNQDNGDCLNDRGYPNSFISKYAPNGNGNGARRAGGKSGGYDAATQARITRSHSQEMALRHIANGVAAGVITKDNYPNGDKLRALISFFDKDVVGAATAAKPAPKPEPEPEPEPTPDDDDGFDL